MTPTYNFEFKKKKAITGGQITYDALKIKMRVLQSWNYE